MKWTIIGCVLFIACSDNTSPVSQSDGSQMDNDTDVISPTVKHLDTLSKQVTPRAKAPTGIYQAILPCTDCERILHTVSFNQNQSFQLQEERWGKIKKISVIKGTWKITDSLIWLYKDQVVAARYCWKRDSLMFVDVRTEKTYPLSKQQSAWENNVWRRKKDDGLEFFGIGNEPFWSIEIDEQDSIRFQLADWPKPIAVKPVLATQSNDSIIYNSVGNNNLQITIYNRFCSDGMSDFVYNNEVKVIYQQRVYNGCGLLYK